MEGVKVLKETMGGARGVCNCSSQKRQCGKQTGTDLAQRRRLKITKLETEATPLGGSSTGRKGKDKVGGGGREGKRV